MKVADPSFSDLDVHLFAEGTHRRLYDRMGAHLVEMDGARGTHFAVWAPNASALSVIGDFNGWRGGAHPMRSLGPSGLWTCFVPGVGEGALYKYAIASRYDGYRTERADPFGFAAELRPSTASRIVELDGYPWGDGAWMAGRGTAQSRTAPLAAYEVHLGSWMRVAEEGNRWLSYRELAPRLVEYLTRLGYTHVEFLPVSEHPFDGSWGYQTVGYYAPTSRFGTPHDFMALVDALHQAGIGVILDWVPAHFPTDGHGLAYFDGTHLYEHADPRLGRHQEWDTFIFNYGRNEVVNFLIANALFWFDRYHVDGLRVDAVASMLYLDYARKPGEWVPNRFGGRENLEALAFVRRLNETVDAEFPDAVMIAEESTTWPGVSKPVAEDGLGFDLKWDMGWMHDTLDYMALDPIHRRYQHHRLTFRQLYAFSERFLLPLSHDEVVHGKGSLLGRMPGDDWQRFANLRLLHAWQYAQPGKKLLFMGGEIGQWREWNHDASLDWWLLEYAPHRGIQDLVRDLNALYRAVPPLYERDLEPDGFAWVDCDDAEQSIVSFLRRGNDADDAVLCAFNFTPVPRHGYRMGVPWGGAWIEVLNTDAPAYGGSGQGNLGKVVATGEAWHGQAQSVALTLPPLAAVALRGRRPVERPAPKPRARRASKVPAAPRPTR
jgi:1,4-alpha-glucan branching enzyme